MQPCEEALLRGAPLLGFALPLGVKYEVMEQEQKDQQKVTLLGFGAVLISIVAFLLLLCLITIAIRFVFALGAMG